MKKNLILAALLAFVSLTTMAQNPNGGQRQRFDPTEMYNRMAERLAKQLKLDDDKAEAFKVLYLDYQTARQNAEKPQGENANQTNPDFKKMTDEEATALIEKQFAAQEAQLAVDKDYLPKFLQLLTPVQAAQVYLRRSGMQSTRSQQGGTGRPAGGFGGGFGGGLGGGNFGGGNAF